MIPKLIGLWFNLTVWIFPKYTAREAFKAFCRVRKGILKGVPKELKTALSEKLELNQHQIQTYCWGGSGKRILLLHGWESNTHRWRFLLKYLVKENYHIYAFDAPAHGLSSGKFLEGELYAKTINLILERYQPEIVIGHSLGGMSLLYGLYLQPAPSVRKVITLGAPSDFIHFMTAYQKIVGFNRRVWDATETLFFNRFGYSFSGFSTAAFSKELNQKALMIHDKEDLQVHYSESEKVHGNWKGSELIITEGYGHSLQSSEVFDAVVGFIDKG